ncbi:MAG: hypothetical protein PHE27_02610, partial [Alphaproteobacteria bacterium]|nr:hypothetical protein [Alphaproteobacteria bacterium]
MTLFSRNKDKAKPEADDQRAYNLFELIEEKVAAAEALYSSADDKRRAAKAARDLAIEAWTRTSEELFHSKIIKSEIEGAVATVACWGSLGVFAITGRPEIMAFGAAACLLLDRRTKKIYNGGPLDPMHDPNLDYKPAKKDAGNKEAFKIASELYDLCYTELKDTVMFRPGGKAVPPCLPVPV